MHEHRPIWHSLGFAGVWYVAIVVLNLSTNGAAEAVRGEGLWKARLFEAPIGGRVSRRAPSRESPKGSPQGRRVGSEGPLPTIGKRPLRRAHAVSHRHVQTRFAMATKICTRELRR